jgi:Protein involved in formate dehydrogenase formation
MPGYAGLRAEWEELLARRSALREPLGFWTAIIDAWRDRPASDQPPLAWSGAECQNRWERGMPLLAEATPVVDRGGIEELAGPVMERLAAAGPEEAEALRRFAEAWDAGEIGPAALFPVPEAPGKPLLQDTIRIPSYLAGFLAQAALRPTLEAFFSEVRHLSEGVWTRGVCPWCGGPAAFGDLVEDGRRRLSCHLCGGGWIAPRLRCPSCQSWDGRNMVRLLGEELEEGYFIEACRSCRAYLKGVDRRQRWNAGSPLVEDWGSPHLDLYAIRQEYRRETPCLGHLLPAEGA